MVIVFAFDVEGVLYSYIFAILKIGILISFVFIVLYALTFVKKNETRCVRIHLKMNYFS